MKCIKLIFFLAWLWAQNTTAQEIYKFEDVSKRLNAKLERPLLINFWATWCVPCVNELSHFDQIHESNKEKYDLLLVCLDDPKNLEKLTQPLLQKKKIKGEVVILDEPNYNKWIDKVSPEWQGSIPATLIVKSDGTKKFFEKPFTPEELKAVLISNEIPVQ